MNIRIFNIIAIIGFLSLTVVSSCKTTEANYRDAYNKAVEKRTNTGDAASTGALKEQKIPKPMCFGADTLMVRTERVSLTPDCGAGASVLKKYCVVVASFRQVFNAKSMCERLRKNGYPDAFVVNNRTDDHYVVAAATDLPSEAAKIIDAVKADASIVLKAPYPYVLRPGQLVR